VCLNVIDPLTCHLKLRSAISRHKRINMEIASSSDGDSKGMATLKQTPDKDQTASKSLAFHFTFPINILQTNMCLVRDRPTATSTNHSSFPSDITTTATRYWYSTITVTSNRFVSNLDLFEITVYFLLK
jgi:hypothetical protein